MAIYRSTAGSYSEAQVKAWIRAEIGTAIHGIDRALARRKLSHREVREADVLGPSSKIRWDWPEFTGAGNVSRHPLIVPDRGAWDRRSSRE